MKTIGQQLWKLSTVMPFLHELENEEVIALYVSVTILYGRAEIVAEKMSAEKFLEQIKKELDRRHLGITALTIRLDQRGNFLNGREELKQYWKTLEFEEMEKMIDEMLEDCNDNQRQAVIDLACEVVKET